MKKTYLAIGICLVFLLAATLPAAAQTCPDEGSGAEGVAEFAEGCGECPDGPVTTCNDEFDITLTDIDRDLVLGLVTYSYEIYKPLPVPEGNDRPNMFYWVLGVDLEQAQMRLAEDKTLEDLFVGCSVDSLSEGMDCGLVLPDPNTQLDGMKFQSMLGDGETEVFTVTLDVDALALGFEIADDCIVAATKAGSQDIQREGSPVPGYACVIGPVFVGEPAQFICPRSQGFWKNHLDEWPIDSITLGGMSYTKDEARMIMRTPTRGDASIILARQLVAAKLNVENGANPDPAQETIDAADDLLATFGVRLPLRVRTYTDTGKDMVRLARVLDAYNNRWLTPNCIEE
jgi:hypothetical protein